MPTSALKTIGRSSLTSNWPTETTGTEIFRISYWRGGVYRRGPLMDNQTIPNPSDLAPTSELGRSVNRFRTSPYVGMHYGGNGPALVVWTRDEPNTNDYSGAQGWDIYRHSIPPAATVIRYGLRVAFDPAWGQSAVRDFMFGIDTCLPSGIRRFFQLRRQVVDPNTGRPVDAWKISSQPDGGGALTFRDLTAGNVGATLTGTLTSAVTASTVTCTALPVALKSGTQLGVLDGSTSQNSQYMVLSADHAAGATTLNFTAITPTHNYPVGAALFYGTSSAFPGFNEHKVNDIVIEMDVDLSYSATGYQGGIVGVKVGAQGFGTRAATPDTTLSTLLPPPPSTLTSFVNGFNFCKIVTNMQHGTPWGSRLHQSGNYRSAAKMLISEEWAQVIS
jgi:hypothetical protein